MTRTGVPGSEVGPGVPAITVASFAHTQVGQGPTNWEFLHCCVLALARFQNSGGGNASWGFGVD
jgi:hypothetical protein